MSERWQAYERGEWLWLDLSDAEDEAVEELSEVLLRCGHWLVGVGELPLKLNVSGSRWQYRVGIELPLAETGEPVLWQAALVRDFPSLLQLFAALRAGDIEHVGEVAFYETGDAESGELEDEQEQGQEQSDE